MVLAQARPNYSKHSITCMNHKLKAQRVHRELQTAPRRLFRPYWGSSVQCTVLYSIIICWPPCLTSVYSEVCVCVCVCTCTHTHTHTMHRELTVPRRLFCPYWASSVRWASFPCLFIIYNIQTNLKPIKIKQASGSTYSCLCVHAHMYARLICYWWTFCKGGGFEKSR